MVKTRSAATIENSRTEVEKLTGKSNYLGWSKIILSELKQRDYYVKNMFVESTKEKAAGLIMKVCL